MYDEKFVLKLFYVVEPFLCGGALSEWSLLELLLPLSFGYLSIDFRRPFE